MCYVKNQYKPFKFNVPDRLRHSTSSLSSSASYSSNFLPLILYGAALHIPKDVLIWLSSIRALGMWVIAGCNGYLRCCLVKEPSKGTCLRLFASVMACVRREGGSINMPDSWGGGRLGAEAGVQTSSRWQIPGIAWAVLSSDWLQCFLLGEWCVNRCQWLLVATDRGESSGSLFVTSHCPHSAYVALLEPYQAAVQCGENVNTTSTINIEIFHL